jgi:hypothetical protein
MTGINRKPRMNIGGKLGKNAAGFNSRTTPKKVYRQANQNDYGCSIIFSSLISLPSLFTPSAISLNRVVTSLFLNRIE